MARKEEYITLYKVYACLGHAHHQPDDGFEIHIPKAVIAGVSNWKHFQLWKKAMRLIPAACALSRHFASNAATTSKRVSIMIASSPLSVA